MEKVSAFQKTDSIPDDAGDQHRFVGHFRRRPSDQVACSERVKPTRLCVCAPVVSQPDVPGGWDGIKSIAVVTQREPVESGTIANLERIGEEDALSIENIDRGATCQDYGLAVRWDESWRKKAPESHVVVTGSIRVDKAKCAVTVGA